MKRIWAKCPTCAGARRRRKQIMCGICWYLVPLKLKRAVWEAFKFKDTIALRIAIREAIMWVKGLTV